MPRRRRKPEAGRTAATQAGTIRAWEDDPGSIGAVPVERPVPVLTKRLSLRIGGRAPAPDEHPVGTAEFRYWATADALRRAADFWTALLPSGVRWLTGTTLPVTL